MDEPTDFGLASFQTKPCIHYLSSGEWRERFGAMGIHIPYEMGSDLELPRVSQPHTSYTCYSFFVGNPVLIPQDHDELVVREPPYCRHRMPIWWLISPYIPLYPWWVNRNVCCKHAMKCIELPSSGLRYRTGKRRILSCLRCTHPSESKHGKWIFFIQYIYMYKCVCIYIYKCVYIYMYTLYIYMYTRSGWVKI